MTQDQSKVNYKKSICDSENCTIQREVHNFEHPYVMISRSLLRDENLDLKSKGLLCYLLSLPDNWKIHPRQLAKSIKVGHTAIYSYLKKLIEAGYARKEIVKSENGQFDRVIYFFSEYSTLPREIQKNSTVSGKPYPEIRTGIKEREEEIIRPPISPKGGAAKAAREMVSFGNHVKLKQTYYDAQVTKLGKALVDDIIEDIELYCESHGKSYASYASAFKTFLKRRRLRQNGGSGLNKENVLQENKEWISKHLRENNPQFAASFEPQGFLIHARASSWQAVIGYNEKGFREQVKSELLKRDLWKD